MIHLQMLRLLILFLRLILLLINFVVRPTYRSVSVSNHIIASCIRFTSLQFRFGKRVQDSHVTFIFYVIIALFSTRIVKNITFILRSAPDTFSLTKDDISAFIRFLLLETKKYPRDFSSLTVLFGKRKVGRVTRDLQRITLVSRYLILPNFGVAHSRGDVNLLISNEIFN